MRKRKNKPDAEGQLEAARIIAADPVKFPGVIQDWAKLVLQKEKQLEAYKRWGLKPPYTQQEPGDDGKPPWD